MEQVDINRTKLYFYVSVQEWIKKEVRIFLYS